MKTNSNYYNKYKKYKTKYLQLKSQDGGQKFNLFSSAFNNGELIPEKFTCDHHPKDGIESIPP
jgi:hypothetical protein